MERAQLLDRFPAGRIKIKKLGVNDLGGNLAGYYKVVSVDHTGFVIGFSDWTPAS